MRNLFCSLCEKNKKVRNSVPRAWGRKMFLDMLDLLVHMSC